MEVVNREALAKAPRRFIEQLNLIGRGEMCEDDHIQEIRRVVGNPCAPALPFGAARVSASIPCLLLFTLYGAS